MDTILELDNEGRDSALYTHTPSTGHLLNRRSGPLTIPAYDYTRVYSPIVFAARDGRISESYS